MAKSLSAEQVKNEIPVFFPRRIVIFALRSVV